ncbi:hypothetical protein GCM10010246_56910 [Streptomyces cuspidosporus]|uniref:Uncharacterized protein n=1 Tax=Streptomyces cuspidosporus TaxID=66882 RepID=A0ABN3GS47_9ACTN
MVLGRGQDLDRDGDETEADGSAPYGAHGYLPEPPWVYQRKHVLAGVPQINHASCVRLSFER